MLILGCVALALAAAGFAWLRRIGHEGRHRAHEANSVGFDLALFSVFTLAVAGLILVERGSATLGVNSLAVLGTAVAALVALLVVLSYALAPRR